MSVKVLRLLGPAFLIIHIALHYFPSFSGRWNEGFIYNSIPLISISVIFFAHTLNDHFSKPLLILAFSFWSLGSIIASFLSSNSTHQLISNFSYLLFYPCAFIALPRIISPGRKFSVLEVFDASIVGLSLSVLGTNFALKPVLPHFAGNLSESFFAIAFPLSDLVLISLTLATLLATGHSRRSVLLFVGVLIFTLTDFLYLGQHINGSYIFGSLLDNGWLVGLILIAESLWHRGTDTQSAEIINPIFVALSVFLSATLLALIAIRPGYFPSFTLIPALITLALAFIRMTIALRQARHIGHERVLARTDELTGLPNRRRLISEIEEFINKEGALLLLDLDDFKPVNDMYGHGVGDKVLQQASLRFSRALPYNAFLARLGGDEFGVIISGSHESAMETALALRATLSYPFKIDNQNIQIGVSIGIATSNGDSNLLRRADDAMYRAKREGLGVCQL